MPGRRKPALGLVARAVIEQRWRETAVRAQIHALMGDNSDAFVNAAGSVLYVALGAMIARELDPDLPEIRVIRGACNALYEQEGEAAITDARRAALRAGLEAVDRLLPQLGQRALAESALELEGKLRRGNVDWAAFRQRLQEVEPA
jgi:hypothetical protein